MIIIFFNHIRHSDEFLGAMHHNRPRHTHKFLCIIQNCKERKNVSFLQCAKGVALDEREKNAVQGR